MLVLENLNVTNPAFLTNQTWCEPFGKGVPHAKVVGPTLSSSWEEQPSGSTCSSSNSSYIFASLAPYYRAPGPV
eukprot:1160758-Pelagomonas_calceolata.AAC.9